MSKGGTQRSVRAKLPLLKTICSKGFNDEVASVDETAKMVSLMRECALHKLAMFAMILQPSVDNKSS